MTTPRDDIAGRETHTVHDPFLKRDVEVSSKLPDRLRGKYAKGPTMPDGEPEFGWSQFETPPIQHEAADALDVAATQLDSLLKERFKLTTDLADMKSRAISAEQERDALQARVKELEAEQNDVKRADAGMDLWRSRALRAEQERDEAYERLKPFAKGWWSHQNPNVKISAIFNHNPFDERVLCTVGEMQAAYSLVRRLAGPEKEGK